MAVFFIVIISLLLFKNSSTTYFFQDDWFVFSISKIASLGDFMNFFIPRNDVQFYRPLSHEVFFLLGRFLFDLNPLGFHIMVWVFFSANTFFVWKLLKIFIKNRILNLIGVFLYATSAIHYNSLFWIVNFSYILVSFWYFLGFFLFVNSKHSFKTHSLILVIFVLGILSNEFMMTFPVILLIYVLLIKKPTLRKTRVLFFGLLFVTELYLIFRFLIYRPNFGAYQFVFDKSIVSSYRFFFMFFLNFPETMKDQMISFYKVNTQFLQTFTTEFYLFFANLLSFIFAFTVIPVFYYFKSKNYKSYIRKNSGKIIFSILWFIITLTPIIFVPSHISPHQGSISFFGFLLIFLVMFEGVRQHGNRYLFLGLRLILITVWLGSTITSIFLNDRIHWIKRRSDISKYWAQKIKKTYPFLEKNSVILIGADDKETKVALRDGLAVNELYNEESIKVIFIKAVP